MDGTDIFARAGADVVIFGNIDVDEVGLVNDILGKIDVDEVVGLEKDILGADALG